MVVTASRLEAVRWMQAMTAYIADKQYSIGLMVAFSGVVEDTHTETTMNPGLHGQDIREAFAGPAYQILIVANKFQTGFDQPLLCAMYVDRKLGGIQAVQTLSRLNRAAPGKDTTIVVDFVNDPQAIVEAFRQYHTTAELADVSDPNVLLDLRVKLDSAGYYDHFEVNRVAAVIVKAKPSQADLDAALVPVAGRLVTRYRQARATLAAEPEVSPANQAAKDARDHLLLFRADLTTYARLYEFLGQLFDYRNTDFEKLYRFAKLLVPLLKFERERDGIDLGALKLTHHAMRDVGRQTLALSSPGEKPLLQPITDAGSAELQDKHKETLAAIVSEMSNLFGADVTDTDKVTWFEANFTKVAAQPDLQAQAQANTEAQFLASPSLKPAVTNALIDTMDAHQALSHEALNSQAIQEDLLAMYLRHGLYNRLRAAGGSTPGRLP
jgi:type I restriction enzyme R subunit